MQYRYLTGTGIQISRMCLGAMTFGGQLDENDAIELTHYALDHGVNFIDTADYYTGGKSEEIVGKALKGRRDKVFVSTKVGFPMGNGPVMGGLSRNYILKQVESSLKKLQTDYIDIYYAHIPDYITPLDETLYTFSRLIDEGKIRYAGISNFAAWQACEAVYRSRLNHLQAPVVSQMVYNILTRGLEQEFIPFIKKYGIGLVIYNPLAGGLLSGKYKRGTLVENTRFTLSDAYRERYWLDENFDVIEELSEIAGEAGISLIDLAYRWCLSQDIVDSMLVGFSNKAQLIQNVDLIGKAEKLSEDILAKCDNVWRKVSGTRFKYNR